MAIFDKPPAEVPAEVLVGASVCLGFGMMFWMLSNIFMAHRSFESCATPAPILAVGLNLAWTTVYAMYIAHTILEYLLLALWIASLLPVVYALIANGPHTYGAGSPAARFMPLILGGVFMAGVAVDFLFVRWWLSEAHRGHGHKAGKSWRGQEDRDTSELTWWTLGLVQLCYSAGAVYLLKRRGHSGGQSHFIWGCRFTGLLLGVLLPDLILWWYWPAAHGYATSPFTLLIYGPSITCDLYFPFLLNEVQATEKVLPNGRVVSAVYAGKKTS